MATRAAATGEGRNARVWAVVSCIPRGRVATYRQVAQLAGIEGPSGARQVGYALAALDVEHIVVCGHSHCGAMTALIDPKSAEGLPAVEDWLSHAAATRRLVKDNYPDHGPAELLNVTIQENVLIQLENLRTHPLVASRLASRRLRLHGWVYKIETGEVFTFHPDTGQFEPVRDFEPEIRPRQTSNLASVL